MLEVTRRQISFIASAAGWRSREGVVNLQKSVENLGPTLVRPGVDLRASAMRSRGGWIYIQIRFLCVYTRSGDLEVNTLKIGVFD